jgi:hypothetical protein
LAAEVCEVVAVALGVDVARRHLGPARLVPRLRARGLRRSPRDASGRARLQRIIRIVDRCFPGGGNCYRRALTELAVDPAAASEPLHMGLRLPGGPGSGHAWLRGSAEDNRGYDAEFVV